LIKERLREPYASLAAPDQDRRRRPELGPDQQRPDQRFGIVAEEQERHDLERHEEEPGSRLQLRSDQKIDGDDHRDRRRTEAKSLIGTRAASRVEANAKESNDKEHDAEGIGLSSFAAHGADRCAVEQQGGERSRNVASY
jgi:hypothetical protein